MKKRQKKPYASPTTAVVWLEASVPLLTDSDIETSTVIDNWGNGGGDDNGNVTY